MKIKNKETNEVFFVLGYNKEEYLLTYLEYTIAWGGFCWWDKKDFEVIDEDRSFYEQEELDEKGIKLTGNFMIPELKLLKLKEISNNPEEVSHFWDCEWTNPTLPAIAYLEKSFRKYPIETPYLTRSVKNGFEFQCTSYLQGYLESIFDITEDKVGEYLIQINYQEREEKIQINKTNWESFLVKEMMKIGHPKLGELVVIRKVIQHLKALMNFEDCDYLLRDSNFSNAYYLNFELVSSSKSVKIEIEVGLP